MNNIQEIKNQDNEVIHEIMEYLDLENPKSFFMLAGAGSGKTGTLVEVLKAIDENYGDKLNLSGRKIAVITYTNAACNEIISRLKHNDLFSVSTIHSFSWQLINTFQQDIKKYIKRELIEDIYDLEEKQSKSNRTSSKAYIERETKLEKNREKLQTLDSIKKFIYSPDGENASKNSLNHAQVIKIFSEFLKRPLMQSIILRKYPIILIDECQDTNKHITDALINLQRNNDNRIVIGFFGDMMQRIYWDGKEDLNDALSDWNKPIKQMNYRCPKRIVKILNRLRKDVDGLVQYSDDSKLEGYIRVYLCSKDSNKTEIEKYVKNSMLTVTKDEGWGTSVESLILEHHMAAERIGFGEFYSILSKSSKYKSKVSDGTLVEAKFFSEQVFPIVNAYKKGEKYKVAQLAKKYFRQFNENVNELNIEKIQYVKESIDLLSKALNESCNTIGYDILNIINDRNDLVLPSSLQFILDLLKNQEAAVNVEFDEDDEYLEDTKALEAVLNLKLSQIDNYSKYMNKEAEFSTHQGVKGLEYPRVMLIINDGEARGFMFSYEKLFNIKAKTATDLKNEKEGKETSVDRTRRLFYVGCSRAEESLAIVLYTDNPKEARENILISKWFEEDELIIVPEF